MSWWRDMWASRIPMTRERWVEMICSCGIAVAIAAIFVIGVGVLSSIDKSYGRDLGQWEQQDPAVKQWFSQLKMPDAPLTSCCGEADAYWADGFEVVGDEYVAILTDERDDAPLRRRHREPGTRIRVPREKVKWDQGNPTGHGVIFLRESDDFVYCYVPPGGV